MSLPLITCPSCNAKMSLDAALGHQGAREALLALAKLHPGNERLQLTVLRYVGLFAPAKRDMGFDRVATLLREVAELLKPARVEWKGQSWPAPLDYWLSAMDGMLARRHEMDLPLDQHNYLRSVVAGNADKASRQAERAQEDQRAGRTPVGVPPPPPPTPAAAAPPPPHPRFRASSGQMESLYSAIGRALPGIKPKEDPNP